MASRVGLKIALGWSGGGIPVEDWDWAEYLLGTGGLCEFGE